MRVKLVLPALAEATDPAFRPIKYALFPPLGLMTLAAHLDPDDEATIEDEHVRPIRLDDTPDVVAIEVYVTSARRAYALADHYRAQGAHVCLGGLHVTARPGEAARHADSVFVGPADESWPRFLTDFRAGEPQRLYRSGARFLHGTPAPRRDLVDRRRYLAPNSLVVSRGCPHACDFCYKAAFYAGGRSFYHRRVDEALAEIDTLPGRHLFFLDDHLFGDEEFALALFEGMRGSNRVWQAAGTVESVLKPGLMERAAEAGLRSLFVGFETLSQTGLASQNKAHNLGRDYAAAVRRLHDLGVMVNASFVFGMDGDGRDVFDRTSEWAVANGIETATFHVLTPYPGTALFRRLAGEGRITSVDWDLYDTRHAVFRPARMSAEDLEAGYARARRTFYGWPAILEAAAAHEGWGPRLRHLAYAGGWKKAEPIWDVLIRLRQVGACMPLLEDLLDAARPSRRAVRAASATSATARSS
ncbi:MAG TPA: radical SAM protein [Coriobacteriia bacterium]|jgi:radical SAM superfamily enzyme YgiQ (UPF0313 family)